MNKNFIELSCKKKRIEELRVQLNELIANRGYNALDPEVIHCSKLLDKYISDYIKTFQKPKNKGLQPLSFFSFL